MKKLIAYIIFSITLFVSCTSFNSSSVTLDGNPTTGYQWTCEITNKDVVALKSKEYNINSSKPGTVGVGGKWTFEFSPLNDGESKILFCYARSWENEPIKTVEYLAVVKKGSLSLFLSEDCNH